MEDEFVPIEARYMKYFDRVLTRNTPPRSTKTRCVFIYGPPGTGKSFTARTEARNVYGSDPFCLSLRHEASAMQWWDGYTGQDTVLIDEFGPGHMKVPEFNALIDEGPHQVQTKGSFMPFTPNAFTSHPTTHSLRVSLTLPF